MGKAGIEHKLSDGWNVEPRKKSAAHVDLLTLASRSMSSKVVR